MVAIIWVKPSIINKNFLPGQKSSAFFQLYSSSYTTDASQQIPLDNAPSVAMSVLV